MKQISDLIYDNPDLTGREIINLYEKYKLDEAKYLKNHFEQILKKIDQNKCWVGKNFNYLTVIRFIELSEPKNGLKDKHFVYLDKIKLKRTYVSTDSNFEIKYNQNILEHIDLSYFGGMEPIEESIFESLVQKIENFIPDNFPDYFDDIKKMISMLKH